MAHDFFALQLAVRDVYLFWWILRDWPDGFVLMTLRNLIPVLNKRTKIVVIDQLMPEPGSVPRVMEKQVWYAFFWDVNLARGRKAWYFLTLAQCARDLA